MFHFKAVTLVKFPALVEFEITLVRSEYHIVGFKNNLYFRARANNSPTYLFHFKIFIP